MISKVLKPHTAIGIVSGIMGALAMLVIAVHFSSGLFEPQERTAQSIGEAAGKVRAAAKRTSMG